MTEANTQPDELIRLLQEKNKPEWQSKWSRFLPLYYFAGGLIFIIICLLIILKSI